MKPNFVIDDRWKNSCKSGVAFGLACIATFAPLRAQTTNPTPLLPSESVSQTLYVSPNGSDNSNGSSGSPFATIQKAVDTAGSSTNTKIVLGNGTYRQYTKVNSGSNTLIFEAQNPGQAIISGTDIFPNWTATGSNGVFSADWSQNWGPQSAKGQLNTTLGWGGWSLFNLRREMVFVNNVRMNQRVGGADYSAGSPSFIYPAALSDLQPGDFTVDDTLHKIFLKPPSGVTLTSTNVEVATRGCDPNWASWYSPTLSRPLLDIENHSNIVLRGLVVQRAATYIKYGATILIWGYDSSSSAAALPSKILVDNCLVIDNNGNGMEINNCREVTVKNSKFNNNGMRGAGMVQVGVERANNDVTTPVQPRNYLWQDCQFNGNAWRGAGGVWGDQNDTAGFKQFGQASNGATLLRCQFNNNFANGFWEDYSGSNTVLDSCLIQNNTGSPSGGYGILHEMTRGPLFVQNSVIRLNNNVGFISSGSPNVNLQNNFLYFNNYGPATGNLSNGKELQVNSDTGRAGGDFAFGLNGWKINKNTIASLGGTYSGQSVAGSVWELNGDSFPSGRKPASEMAYQLFSNNNIWSKNPNDSRGSNILFALGSDSQFPNVTLSQWQAQTGNVNGAQDLNSIFSYPIDLSGVPDPTTGATINAGVSGTATPTPSSLTNRATGGTASASSAPVAGEGAAQAFDGGSNTKWLGNWSNPSWLQYTFPSSKAYTITQYRIASANDVPARDPKSWTLQASNDGSIWTNLSASQSNQTFASRNTFNANYSLSNTTAYKSYRLLITANGGDGLVQLSELQLLGDPNESGNGGSTFVVPVGKTVGLKSASTSQYVSTNLNSSANLQANYAGSVGSWEKYRVDDAGGGKIGLFSLNNSKYVSVNQNSGGVVQAGFATSIGSWEQFTWTDAGSGQIALLSGISGKYVTVTSNGLLNGNTSSNIGNAEAFTPAIQ